MCKIWHQFHIISHLLYQSSIDLAFQITCFVQVQHFLSFIPWNVLQQFHVIQVALYLKVVVLITGCIFIISPISFDLQAIFNMVVICVGANNTLGINSYHLLFQKNLSIFGFLSMFKFLIIIWLVAMNFQMRAMT